jgi:hypothetical protein
MYSGSIRIDAGAAGEQASCCWVNLAFAGLGMGCFLVFGGWEAVHYREGELFPKWDKRRDFGVVLETIRIDAQVTGVQASCCGVNLAFSGLGVGRFFGFCSLVGTLWGC